MSDFFVHLFLPLAVLSLVSYGAGWFTFGIGERQAAWRDFRKFLDVVLSTDPNLHYKFNAAAARTFGTVYDSFDYDDMMAAMTDPLEGDHVGN